MTFFCRNCCTEIEPLAAVCHACGSAQDQNRFTFLSKVRAALNHPVVEIRRRAILLLGEMHAAEAVEDLNRVIAGESDPFLAKEATIALSKIGNESALYGLTVAARHQSFMVRAQALEALNAAGGYWSNLASFRARSDPSPIAKRAIKPS